MAPTKRKSYSIKFKLGIIDKKKVSTLSNRKFAQSVSLEESIIRRWLQQEDKLRELATTVAPVRKLRRLPRVKVGAFPTVDSIVEKWVKARNSTGLRVKDKFIRIRAVQARNELVAAMDDGPAKEKLKRFDASRIWCHRFKVRFGFVSRRHTTAHSLPVGFREDSIAFLKKFQDLCTELQVERKDIINLDQVPRYFENNVSSTITVKGSKNVLMRKGSSSHKRFTFTPFITADGRLLIKHALFSKLKNVPKHNAGCRVSTNSTGMWNMNILQQNILEAAKLCRGLFDTRRNVIVLLDSYGVHTKFAREFGEEFKEKNIHLIVIPAKLTGILQPLDVGVNRSFQQSFNDKYNDYLEESISQNTNKTPGGNIRMPSPLQVTDWIQSWSATLPAAQISKAFDLCGLVPAAEYSLERLHAPLRDILNNAISINEWIAKHSECLDSTQLVIDRDWDVFEGNHSLLRAVQRACENTEDFKDWSTKVTNQLIEMLTEDELTNALVVEEDKESIRTGKQLTRGFLEAYAIAKMYQIQLHMIELDSLDVLQNRFIFGEQYPHIVALYYHERPLKVILPTQYNEADVLFVEMEDMEASEDETEAAVNPEPEIPEKNREDVISDDEDTDSEGLTENMSEELGNINGEPENINDEPENVENVVEEIAEV